MHLRFSLLCTMVPLERDRAPKHSFPHSYFMKTMQLQAAPFCLSGHESDLWQRLVHSTSAFRHLYLLVCTVSQSHGPRTLHPLLTEQGLLAERLHQPHNAVCAYRPRHRPQFVTGSSSQFVRHRRQAQGRSRNVPGIRFPQS